MKIKENTSFRGERISLPKTFYFFKQQIWSPYGGMQNPAAVTVRYHHQQPPPPVGTPINRYPNGYSQQSTSQQNTPAGAVNSSQLLAASQQQQHSLAKHQTKGRIASNFYFLSTIN